MRIEGEKWTKLFWWLAIRYYQVKSDPTFFSGDSQLVIETEKQKRGITRWIANHQKKVNTLFCVNHQSPITNNQKSEI